MARRKPRSDSKLDNLPDHQFMELRDGLLAGWKYDDALSWLATECGVSSSLDPVSNFYRNHCAPIVEERRQLAALKAEALIEDAGSTDWDAASIEKLRQMVFEFMNNPEADIEATERLFKLLLKSRDQEMGSRKLALLEAKAKQADEAQKVANDDSLSEEEKAANMKRIFRLG